MTSGEHECVFVEEQEPSGRLILPPCIVCGTTAMDALEQLREWDETRTDDLAKCRARLAAVLEEAADLYSAANEVIDNAGEGAP